MLKQLLPVLTDIGLTDKEAKIYLSLIELGTSIVSQIAGKAKINRVTTYDILKRLKEKGLVSTITKNHIKYFSPTDPEIVASAFEQRTKSLTNIVPDLKRLRGETAHPRIQYFEGLKGIKAIYEDTLSAKTEILNFSNSEEIRSYWPTYDRDYVAKRTKRRIFLKGIIPADEAGKKVHAEDSKYHREMRLIPKDKYNFTNEINIYNDKVAIISFADEVIGMIIQSKEIANTQRAVFQMCWDFAGNSTENNLRLF